MTIYQQIRAAVPIGQAARRYGLAVSQGGMALCPFHHDTHPSLKLNEDYFFCFGCGATGDVIDFTARLLGISQREAAQKLASEICKVFYSSIALLYGIEMVRIVNPVHGFIGNYTVSNTFPRNRKNGRCHL